VVASCSGCAGGEKVGDIGDGAANYVTINDIDMPSAGTYMLTIAYCLVGDRTFDLSINGGAGIAVPLTCGTSWVDPVSYTMAVSLNAGENTIQFSNDTAYAPDLSETRNVTGSAGTGCGHGGADVVINPTNSGPGKRQAAARAG
jgi:alpha-galactosidase